MILESSQVDGEDITRAFADSRHGIPTGKLCRRGNTGFAVLGGFCTEGLVRGRISRREAFWAVGLGKHIHPSLAVSELEME